MILYLHSWCSSKGYNSVAVCQSGGDSVARLVQLYSVCVDHVWTDPVWGRAWRGSLRQHILQYCEPGDLILVLALGHPSGSNVQLCVKEVGYWLHNSQCSCPDSIWSNHDVQPNENTWYAALQHQCFTHVVCAGSRTLPPEQYPHRDNVLRSNIHTTHALFLPCKCHEWTLIHIKIGKKTVKVALARKVWLAVFIYLRICFLAGTPR